MITPENIISQEFIGMNTMVVRSTNPQIIGLNGGIIDETKSMFTIHTKKGIRRIAKNNSTWEFVINGTRVPVTGADIQKRPYDRIRS